jgi:hypothetical protein
MLNELSHYLKKSYTKGSSVEIANAQESENENRVEIITYPKYIIYDFETDTSTDIHKPNHVEIDILKIDNDLTHTYDTCLQDTFNINGYGCENNFVIGYLLKITENQQL